MAIRVREDISNYYTTSYSFYNLYLSIRQFDPSNIIEMIKVHRIRLYYTSVEVPF